MKVFIVKIGHNTRKGYFEEQAQRAVCSETMEAYQVQNRAANQYKGFSVIVEECQNLDVLEYDKAIDKDVLPF